MALKFLGCMVFIFINYYIFKFCKFIFLFIKEELQKLGKEKDNE